VGSSRPTHLTNNSDDVYHDYVSIVVGFTYDAPNMKWRLDSATTTAEYESWESHMVHAFVRCRAVTACLEVILNILLPTD
jgi:hypothetical protein